MKNRTKILKLIDEKNRILTNEQKASMRLSIGWKQESRKLFDLSRNENDFYKAVYWCGKQSGVLRSVKHNELKVFSNLIYLKLNDITNGNAKVEDILNTEKLSKKPYSYCNKILHIINPEKYPLIYDNKIIKLLNEENIDFDNACIELKSVYKNDYDSFKKDSILWASQNIMTSDTGIVSSK